MESIQASRIAPLRKARLLLRLGRALRPQVKSLTTAKQQVSRTTDRTATAAMTRMAGSAHRMHEDLREAAFYALRAEQMNN